MTAGENTDGKSGANANSSLRRAAAVVWTTGDFLADAILLLVIVGVAAEWMWALGWNSDAVGFAWLGGGFGYLMAYFAFVLFGLMGMSGQGERCLHFWRGLHPFNLGLAGVAAAAAWTRHFPAQFIAVGVGVAAALVFGERMLAHPRKLTAGCLAAIFAGRAFLPWHWLTSLGAGAGAFLILMAVKGWTRRRRDGKAKAAAESA